MRCSFGSMTVNEKLCSREHETKAQHLSEPSLLLQNLVLHSLRVHEVASVHSQFLRRVF